MNRAKRRAINRARKKKAGTNAAAKAVLDRIEQTEALRRQALEAEGEGIERQDR